MTYSRRKFIHDCSLGIAGICLDAIHLVGQVPNDAPKKRLGVALVGLGYYSTEILAPALQQTKHCYLAGIVTGTPWKKEQWRNQYNLKEQNCYTYDTFDDIHANPDIDILYIVLPTALHKDYVLRAAKVGKHVWCEKPMAVTVADCKAMISACKEHNVSLSLGYRMHHEPNTQWIIDAVRKGRFGNTRDVTVAVGIGDHTRDTWRQKKAMGGGAALDLGVYAIQAARYAVGEEPTQVFAQYRTFRKDIYTEVEEAVALQLSFPNGAIAKCTASFGTQMNSLQAYCESGWFRLEPFQAYKGVRGSSSEGPLDFTIGNQQVVQMDQEALAIMEQKPPIVSGEEGLNDIKILEAVYRSAHMGIPQPI